MRVTKSVCFSNFPRFVGTGIKCQIGWSKENCENSGCFREGPAREVCHSREFHWLKRVIGCEFHRVQCHILECRSALTGLVRPEFYRSLDLPQARPRAPWRFVRGLRWRSLAAI